MTLGHITWGISDGIWLATDQFSITGASTFPVDLNLTHIYARVAVLPLLSKNIEIEELALDGAGVVIKLKPGTDESKTDKPITEKIVVLDDKASLLISVAKLSIQNGRIRIENELTLPDQRLVHNLKAVNIEAFDIIPGREIAFSFSLVGDGAEGLGSLQAQGSFTGLTQIFVIEDPKLKFKALLSSFDTKFLNPYLKNYSLDNKLESLVSLDIKYEGDLLSHHSVEGAAELSDFRFHSSSNGEDIFFEGKTKIGCRAIVDPRDIRVEALDIKIGNNRLNTDGLIKNWNGQPIVQDILVSASLFPKELVGLVPWELMNRDGNKLADNIRPALEAGGQLEIEKFGIGSIPLTGPFPDPLEFLSQLKLAARVSKISIPLMPGMPSGMPTIEQVSGSIGLANGSVTLKDFQFKTSYSLASIEALNARVDITPDRINIEEFSTAVAIPKGSETQAGRFSIKLIGRLDDWQKEPVALVQSFSTSPIPLNPVALIIPWDQIPREQAGDKVDFLKEVLLAGGSLEVKNCSLPGINFKKSPSDIKKVLSKTKAGLGFSDIQMRPGPAYPLFDGISGNVTIDKGVLNISETRGRMGRLHCLLSNYRPQDSTTTCR